MQVPLFPLKTVLLPRNQLPLRIFEPRYSDMVAECMRADQPFGVVLIHEGEETESNIEIFTVGTLAKIIDWENRDDGLLGITAEGNQRFQVLSTRTQPNGLLLAEIEILPEEELEQIPDQYYYMLELLNHVTSHKFQDHLDQDFTSILFQLIYLLPLDNTLKQQLLEVPYCSERAVVLHAELIRLGIIQYVKPGQE